MKGRFFGAVLGVGLTLLSWSTRARADVPVSRIIEPDNTPKKPEGSSSNDPSRGVTLGGGYFDAWYSTSPDFTLHGNEASRELVGLQLPRMGSQFQGFSVDIGASGIVTPYDNSRFLVLRVMSATGPLPSGTETANGAPVSVQMKSLNMIEFEAPPLVWNGFQIADASNRVRLMGYLGFGFTYASGSATFVTPRGSGDQSVGAFSVLLRPEADGCLRIVSPVWACGTASASVYEYGWFSGAALGGRVELVWQ